MHPQLTRPIYWNIEFPGIDLLMAAVAVALAAAVGYGLYSRYRLWAALGRPEVRWDRPWERVLRVLGSGFGQNRVLQRAYAGPMHLMILVGFVLLFIGTCLVAIERDIGQKLLGYQPVAFLAGNFYSVFSFVLDVAGVLVIVGCCMALYRRFIQAPTYLEGITGFGRWTFLLLVVSISGFYLEAARIAHSSFVIENGVIVEADPSLEKWASPVGYALAQLLPTAAVSPKAQHFVVWWGHAFVSFWFIIGFGYSILRHAFTGTANIFFAQEQSTGTLQLIPNMEEAESFGVTTVNEFSWKTLFDGDACVSCGRCNQHCPATLTGKPLQPKRIIQQIRKAWEPAAAQTIAGGAVNGYPTLIGEYISEDEIWSCTSCGACMHQCPVHIEHIPAIVDMRRSLVMMESRFPEEAQVTLVNLENAGNPWGLDNTTRVDWAKGLNVPTIAENSEPEVLVWVGCAGSFDARAKPTTRAFVRLLEAARVNFAVLGSEERCCGDPARRIGHEYLYVSLAQFAVETLNGYGVKKIVTTCPHCFHTIANEYPQLGGRYEVIHHTEYIDALIASGRLVGLGEGQGELTAYHDSCYLGRHNKVYEGPRNNVKKAGHQLIELPRSRSESFCCGAGGGRMWMEEHLGEKKINIARSEEVISADVKQAAVACPFCKTMLTDGLKEKGREDIRVRDVAELLAEKLPGGSSASDQD